MCWWKVLHPRLSYKQQLFLIMKIDSFHLLGCYLNKWEEQNTVPWSLSVALYPCKFKAEDRTNPSFCFPAVFSLKHVADEGLAGEDSLAPSLPHPAVKARLVGRMGLHRLWGPSVFNLLSGGRGNSYTALFPEPRQLDFSGKKKAQLYKNGSQSPVKLKCLISSSFPPFMDFASIIIKLLLFLFSTVLFCLRHVIMS